MKLFSANIEGLTDLYITNLKKAYDLEHKISVSMPELIEASTDTELANALRVHLEESKGHVRKVEALLQKHTGEASAETCKVMNGLATEASDTIKDVTDPNVRDIALIGAAQQVEHHEIAVYGTLRQWAQILGLENDAQVLKSIEQEEINADNLLTEISEKVNLHATV